MVHQLLILHEAAATEVASASVPGDASRGRGSVTQQGGAASLGEAMATVGEEAGEQRSSDHGEWGRTEVIFCNRKTI